VAVKLRLMRMGKKKQPTYRIVAADSRSPRDGRFIEIVGTYDPRAEPSVIKVDNERAVHWLRHGAQPTERVQKLLQIVGAWDEFKGNAPATPAAAPAEAPAPEADAEPVPEAAEAAS
jgi:small subunit ribosomal protein S16